MLSDIMERSFDPRFGEAWSRAQLGGALLTPDSWAERIDADGECAGFALIRRVVDEAELLLLTVLPEWRGQGLGRRLVEAAATGASQRGARTLFLEVRDGNDAASLYRATGFVEIGRRKHYYTGATGARYDSVTMRRNLF